MRKREDKDTRYFIDLDLSTNRILGWDYDNRHDLIVEKPLTPAHHRGLHQQRPVQQVGEEARRGCGREPERCVGPPHRQGTGVRLRSRAGRCPRIVFSWLNCWKAQPTFDGEHPGPGPLCVRSVSSATKEGE